MFSMSTLINIAGTQPKVYEVGTLREKPDKYAGMNAVSTISILWIAHFVPLKLKIRPWAQMTPLIPCYVVVQKTKEGSYHALSSDVGFP